MNVVLYHASCADGFGAAWAAHKTLGNSAVYVPVQYGKPYPPEIDGGVSCLYILDFSYPLETLLRLNRAAKRMVIRDHHETTRHVLQEFQQMQDESQISGVDVGFAEEKSGAVLTWEHFFPREPVPVLLQYVQDRDLWLWALEKSREINALIGSYPFEFTAWDALANRLDDGYFNGMVREGEAVLRYQEQQVEMHCAHARLGEVGGYEVPILNATTLQSQIGERLCEKFPKCPFAATYFIREDGVRVWSLRSRNGFDVSAVAKAKGGGGHKAAAGFTEA